MSVRAGAFLQPTRIAGLVVVALLLLGASDAMSQHEVQAVPQAPYDGCIQNGNNWECPLTVTVQGSGMVTSNDGKISNCSSSCTATYPYFGEGATSVSLTATESGGWRFLSWSGCNTASGATCRVTMDEARSVTAAFERTSYRLTVNLAGTGTGTVTGPGVSCPNTCVVEYAPGTSVEITATPSGGSTWGNWSGSCMGTATTCKLSMTADHSVTATFNATVVVKRTLKVSVTGTGKVTGPGIDCPTDCEQQYDSGTNVQLTAAPGSGMTTSWSGDCTGTGTTCSLTMSSDRSVSVSFLAPGQPPPSDPGVTTPVTTTPTPAPVATPAGTPVIDQALDPLPAKRPVAVEQLIVKVAGTGNVNSSPAGRVTAGAKAARRINCGVTGSGRIGFDCYGEYRPGEALTLKAKAAPGYVFKRWTGACAGSGPTCRVVTKDARTTTAVFEATGTGAAVAALLKQPRLKVRWRASVGAGTLVMQGSTSVPATARIDMRRPGGGPLATRRLKLQGGAFRQTLPLRRGALAGNAKLFPGGFTVALTGRSGRLKLPLQMQTIAIPAPVEGVVRRAFKSTSENGRAVTRLPAGAKEAWANFRFETQPRMNQRVTVRWYWPGGKLLGTVPKSNRPVISSYLRLATGLPSGLWVAELRAGKRVVQRLSVRVG